MLGRKYHPRKAMVAKGVGGSHSVLGNALVLEDDDLDGVTQCSPHNARCSPCMGDVPLLVGVCGCGERMAWLTQGLKSLESALERVDQQAASTLTTLGPLRVGSNGAGDEPPQDDAPLRAASPVNPSSPTKSAPSSAKKEVPSVRAT